MIIKLFPCENVNQICPHAETCESFKKLKKVLVEACAEGFEERKVSIQRITAAVVCEDFFKQNES